MISPPDKLTGAPSWEDAIEAIKNMKRENDQLKHDLERQMAINAELCSNKHPADAQAQESMRNMHEAMQQIQKSLPFCGVTQDELDAGDKIRDALLSDATET